MEFDLATNGIEDRSDDSRCSLRFFGNRPELQSRLHCDGPPASSRSQRVADRFRSVQHTKVLDNSLDLPEKAAQVVVLRVQGTILEHHIDQWTFVK